MLNKIKKELEKLVIKDSEYNFVIDDICENNRRTNIVISAICVGIFTILLLLGALDIGVERKDLPIFALALVFSAAILAVSAKSTSKNRMLNLIITYVMMGLGLFYGLLISYRSPEQYTVTFIALICIMSMTYVDKPLRIGAGHILATALCIGMVAMHKSKDILSADIINILSFSALSFIGGFFTVKTKIHGYVMDKLQEEDIELGRKKLNENEVKALQLLTAVKANYDMVVSVNLTKNTYSLIGDESFVTQGDAVHGVFDEVIDIHAGKVVKEHKQKYLDTFSRAGLLRAYAEGKKEVYLEYQQCDENGVPHWLGTHTMFILNPYSTDVTEITISQNIDERVRKDAETKAILQAERDRAESAQKAKTDFLFQMSHDIRTPMNAIIGFANFIKSSDDLYTIHNDYVIKLETAGQQLLMLINDALEMSRIESGKLVFRREVQDIRSIITNVMAVMQIQAEEKSIELISDFSVKDPIVNCDQNHMNRVIMNLLSNAVKFTPAGGRVTVSLHQKPDAPEGRTAFELKISDTGIGMSPEFLERVFEPFEREQTSTVSGMQGTGLGLAIVKRIVETAGDTIFVESKQGEGTVFTLNLALYKGEGLETSDNSEAESELPPIEHMSDYFKGKRMLLVEDNEFNLTIARTLLENAGFSVETATDGSVAVNKVKGAPTADYYDAILMDIQMPTMNGYEATRAIRELPDGRANTVIMALTANAFDTDKENSLSAGMNGHIAKPIDVAILYKTLWKILK